MSLSVLREEFLKKDLPAPTVVTRLEIATQIPILLRLEAFKQTKANATYVILLQQ